jgi:hypothetical protein
VEGLWSLSYEGFVRTLALHRLASEAAFKAREAELVDALRELWRYGVNSEVVSIEEYHGALDRTADLLAKIDGETA